MTGLLCGGAHEQAYAHALLVSADPPVNAQLRDPPEVLTLFFSEPLERRFSSVHVVDQDGVRVDESVEFDDANDGVMHVRLSPLQPGFISISWQTVSTVDGHRISGSYPLTILNEDGSLPSGGPVQIGASVSGAEAEPGRVVSRWLILVGLAALAGSLAFVTFVSPAFAGASGRHTRRRFEAAAILVALGAVILLALAGVLEVLVQAADLDTGLRSTLETRWGDRWIYRGAALAVSAIAIILALLLAAPRAKRALLAIALAAALVQMGFLASVGHGAAGQGAFWAAGADFVHLLGASIWIGLLAILTALFIWVRRSLGPGERYPVLAAALQRFSLLALISLALLLFTGVFNALVELESFADLLDSGYGRALSVKLVLLLPLLFVAAHNAYLLRPEFVEEVEETDSDQRANPRLAELESRLGRFVRLELGLALVVLAVVALLVQLTPPRGRADAGPALAGQFITTGEEGGIQFTLVIEPNLPGINTFEIFLTGAVETVERVRLDISPQDQPEEEARLILDESNPPTFYLGQGPFLSAAGEWQVLVDVRRSAGGGRDLSIPVLVEVPAGDTPAPAPAAGDFSLPVSLSLGAAALLTGTALVSIGLILASQQRPGLTAGYAGLVAEEVSFRLPRLSPIWSLAGLIVIGVIIGLIVGAHRDEPLSPEEASRANPVPATEASIERGRMLFLQNCTQCHGESGRGDGPLAASLPIPPANLYDHIPFHVDQFFFGVITNGLGDIMPAFEDSISEEDRWNILNFLRDQFGQPPPLQ